MCIRDSFHAILSLHCVSVQCVFPCYPLLVLCLISVCISALSCPSCFSSACILVLSLWCVQCVCVVFQFSVYFHTILSKQSTPNDMKSWPTKAPEDYTERSALRWFHHPFKSRILLTQVSPVCIWLYPDTLKLNSRCKYISHMVIDFPHLKKHTHFLCMCACKCM